MTTTFPAPPSKSPSHNAPGNALSLLLHHFASLFSRVDEQGGEHGCELISVPFKPDQKVNQGGRMVEVADVVVWPEVGAVNKLDEKK